MKLKKQLKIKVRPLSWPINNGPDFKGVYNIFNRSLKLFKPDIQTIEERIKFEDISNPELENYIGSDAQVLREELDLVEGVYP
jgi:peptide chain release factor 3